LKELRVPGDFYVQFNGDLCAYHIPGGSFSMRFTGSDFVFVDDGQGGRFLEGTSEVPILEGTGIYKPFVGFSSVRLLEGVGGHDRGDGRQALGDGQRWRHGRS
jgi:hypothetical protein